MLVGWSGASRFGENIFELGRTVVKNQELVISKLARRLTGHSKEINCPLDISKKLTARFVPQFLHPRQVTANCSFS